MPQVRLFIDPTIVLVSMKIDDAVIDRFDPNYRNGESQHQDNDQFRIPFALEVRPNNEFDYDIAKDKLINLQLPEERETDIDFKMAGETLAWDGEHRNTGSNRQGQFLRVAGRVSLDSRITVRTIYLGIRLLLTSRSDWLCRCFACLYTKTTRRSLPSWGSSSSNDVSGLFIENG
jgi:hypothetical protein